MKQQRVTNVEIALRVIDGLRDNLWHDTWQWWWRRDGQWVGGRQATRVIREHIDSTTFPATPYWERAAPFLRSVKGRGLLMRLMYRMLQRPEDFPHDREPSEWRFRPPFLITAADTAAEPETMPPPASVTAPSAPRRVPHEDSYILIEGSVGRLQPGTTYTAADLYAAYVAISKERGLPPVSDNLFGRHLKKLGCVPGRNPAGTARVWTMPAARD